MKRQEIIFSPRLRLLALCFRQSASCHFRRTQATVETGQVALFSRTNGLFKNLRAQLEVRCRCTATMLHHQLRAPAEPVAEALD